MNKINRFFLSITAVCVMGLIPITVVWSADEDMISQVYLEFDPETGEFVTARDPLLTGNSMHSAGQAKQVEQIQQAQDALASQGSAQTQSSAGTQSSPVAAAPVANQPTSGQGNFPGGMAGSNSAMVAGVIIALLVVGGIVAWKRKGQQAQT